MNLRFVILSSLFGAVLALTGCDSGRQSLPRVNVRIVNAAPGFSQLTYRREQDARQGAILDLAFKNAQQVDYDIDTYDFFVFEPSFNGGATGRTWSFTQQLVENMGYTFVLTETSTGEMQPVVLESGAAPAGDAQILALHAGANLQAMDLYLQRPGVGIAGATPVATLAPGAQLPARTFASGDYELWLTAAGDPATVLLASGAFNLPAAETSTFIVVPESGRGTSTLSVLLLQSAFAELIDRNATSELRIINAATDGLARDVAIDNQFSPPLFDDIAFATPTAYAEVPVNSALPFTVTPFDNPGVLELNQTIGSFVTQRATLLFTGPAGALVFTSGIDDGRRLPREAKVRFMNTALQFPTGIDFVVTQVDGDPNQTFALVSLSAPGMSVQSSVAPGEYDLYLRQFATATILSGPTRITLNGGGLYSVLAVNGADTATASVVLLDDFVAP